MSEDPRPPQDEEWVPEDDAVIGRAFRRSLWVIGALGLVVAAVLLWPRREERREERTIESEAPVGVEREALAPAVEFRDVTETSGVDFVHVNGAYGDKLLPESLGGGVAVFDADGDGDADLLFTNGTRWPSAPAGSPRGWTALYANDGSGRFRDVSQERGVALELYGTGIAVGDVDGDGDRDVFLAAVGRNRLLRNDGERFTDVTASAGVAGDEQDWSSSSAFFDADGDGDLDLFVGNYVQWSRQIDLELDYRLTGVGRAYGPPLNYAGTFSRFYRNRGDGRFEDVSEAVGIRVVNPATGEPMGKVLGVSPVDVDGDRRLDLFVANDTVRNFLFLNRGDRFEEAGELLGVAYDRQGVATGAMGVDAAHYRDDGELAFLVANFANEMTSLYVSQGGAGLFADESIVEGIGAPTRRVLSFGVFFFDYDLDGRLDLLQANGHLEEEIATVDPSQSYRQPTQLFWNAGQGGLVPVDEETTGDLATPIIGRATAYGDLDGDGDLDVVVTQTGARPYVFRNDQDTGHHWLRVRLVGDGGSVSTDAIGAWVEVEAGGRTQRRQVMPTRGYQSQSELPVTFGLGAATAVEALRVEWPDGTVSEHPVDAVDRVVELRR